MDEASIERLAEEELLQEAKRGAARASVDGPAGWQKCPLPKTNKRFLHNTILHSLQSNRVRSPRRPDPDRRRRLRAEDREASDEKRVGKRSDKNAAPHDASSGSEKKVDVTQRRPSSHGDDPVK